MLLCVFISLNPIEQCITVRANRGQLSKSKQNNFIEDENEGNSNCIQGTYF
jgi:hypothetical protein